jgi:hypothetical protein
VDKASEIMTAINRTGKTLKEQEYICEVFDIHRHPTHPLIMLDFIKEKNELEDVPYGKHRAIAYATLYERERR